MIERHLLDDFSMYAIKECCMDNLDSINVILNKTISNSYLVASLQEIYLQMSILELFINNNKEKSWDYLVKSNNCNYTLYKLANNIGKPVKIESEGLPQIELTGEIRKTYILPWDFIDHIKFAFLTKNKEQLNKILSFNTDLYAPSDVGLSAEEYHTRFAKTIISFLKKDKPDNVLLEDIIDFIKYLEDWAKKKKRKLDKMGIYIDLNIFKSVLENDNDRINTLIEKQILSHKEYYSIRGHEPNTEGLYSYKVSGMCAFLTDIGFKITVESEYLPGFLIDGEFTKEKLTWPMV